MTRSRGWARQMTTVRRDTIEHRARFQTAAEDALDFAYAESLYDDAAEDAPADGVAEDLADEDEATPEDSARFAARLDGDFAGCQLRLGGHVAR